MTQQIRNYELKNVLYDIVNKEDNSKFLQKIPHMNISNLAIIFYFDDTKDLITFPILNLLKLNTRELFKVAKTNMHNKYPSKIIKTRNRKGEMLFYRITNDSRSGISAILTEKTKRELKLKSNEMYIFFISNREVIALDPKQFNISEAMYLLKANEFIFGHMEGYFVTSSLYRYIPGKNILEELDVDSILINKQEEENESFIEEELCF